MLSIPMPDFDPRSFFGKVPFHLELAGIFFVAAWDSAKVGSEAYRRFESKRKRYSNLFRVRASGVGKNLTRQNRSVEADDDALTQNLQDLRRLEVYYEPVVRHFSLATVLLVACAETYVNEVAAVAIAGQGAQDHFNKLSVVGKWLFLPEILGMKQLFRLDRAPLQGFAELVRRRNRLMHFRAVGRQLAAHDLPPFLDELSLVPKASGEGIDAVRDLIRSFSLKWTGSYGPEWLHPEEETFRRPCFYLVNRENRLVLYAEEIDGAKPEA